MQAPKVTKITLNSEKPDPEHVIANIRKRYQLDSNDYNLKIVPLTIQRSHKTVDDIIKERIGICMNF